MPVIDRSSLLEHIHCAVLDCHHEIAGVWLWRAIDQTIGVPFCTDHEAVLKAALARAGRAAGGATIDDLKG